MADKPQRKPRPRKPIEVELPPAYKGDITASMAKAVVKHTEARIAKIEGGGDPRGPTLLEERDPALVAKVLDSLVHGKDKKRIARECGIEVHTVRDIFKRHIDLIGGWRDYAVARATETRERLYAMMDQKLDQLAENPAMLAKERTVDLAKSIEAMDKTILGCHGITQAGTNVVVNLGPSIEDAMKFQAELRAKIEAAKAEKRADSVSV